MLNNQIMKHNEKKRSCAIVCCEQVANFNWVGMFMLKEETKNLEAIANKFLVIECILGTLRAILA